MSENSQKSADIDRFIQDRIESVPHLEALLLLWRERLAVRARLGALPDGITWAHIHGATWLAGIGFTMSIFVAGLAFKDEAFVNTAKLGIFAASLLAGIAGSILLPRKSAMTQEFKTSD